ncbi:MAG: Ppx/GppA family phosphatase [Ignavibacteria bacterium]|nr:Ppx/GppA family phosphatase [Ignavibacteria bacterium]
MNKILAAIDIGTNSFHLIVVKTGDKGTFKIITREKEVVRLGKSSSDMKYISVDAVHRAISTLKRFKLICDSFNAEIRTVATSAVREALNGEDFISEVFYKTGIKIEIVSGYEEARLIYMGVLQALPVFKKKILLIDIGGGSTEMLIGEKGEVIYANSTKIGTVRLTERFFPDKKFTPDAIEEAKMYTRSVLFPVLRRIKEYSFDTVVGSSGTISTIGSMIYFLENPDTGNDSYLNNYVYNKESLYQIVKKITRYLNVNQIEELRGLDSQRADIITAGAIILEQIFLELDVNRITVSNYALREGIILDTIDKISGHRNLGAITDIRYKSVLSLAEQCDFDRKHSEQTLKLSVKIFDFLLKYYPDFELSIIDKEYLEAASLLHDIGHSISHSQHHRHSYYLICNSDLLGFNNEELEVIANIARYHRKSHPKLKHDNFEKLNAINKDKVRKLSGILRVSDGLDRGHSSAVADIEMEKSGNEINLFLKSNNSADLTLEIWGANMRKELFEESFNLKLNILG